MLKAGRRLSTLLVLCLPLGGCFGNWAKKLADKEVYPIIDKRRQAVLGRPGGFTVERPKDQFTGEVLTKAGTTGSEYTTDGLKLSLSDALGLAIHNSREYQNQKENLYLTALDLTAARYEFSPIFTGFIAGNMEVGPGGLNPKDPTRLGTINTKLAVSQLFATGARATASISNSLFRFYGGNSAEAATGVIAASIVQPLLRGAGPSVALEGLKQAERDLVYGVRSFARFERSFVVDRISDYFRLLQQLNIIENERASYESFRLSRIQSESLKAAGRVGVLQLDQAHQQELIAENRVINAEASYVQSLDRYKVTLGLPTELNIMPDKAQLDELEKAGLQPLSVSLTEAVERALKNRLDYKTTVEEVEDAQRKIHVAENGLLPDLNATAGISVPDEGKNQPLSFDTKLKSYNYGAQLDLPLDRKTERNNYRKSLIAFERAERTRGRTRDTVVQEVRLFSQNLEEARHSYEIQLQNREVADRRVENSKMQYQAGRIEVRNVLESQTDQRDAYNAVTGALIDYAIARLRFLVAIEALDVDDKGMWNEIKGENNVASAKS